MNIDTKSPIKMTIQKRTKQIIAFHLEVKRSFMKRKNTRLTMKMYCEVNYPDLEETCLVHLNELAEFSLRSNFEDFDRAKNSVYLTLRGITKKKL